MQITEEQFQKLKNFLSGIVEEVDYDIWKELIHFPEQAMKDGDFDPNDWPGTCGDELLEMWAQDIAGILNVELP